jgi:nucleoside-diphosphate-sugar epimerase
MKILITGGAGFLGSRLARALLSRNELSGVPLSELVLTDLYTSSPEIQSHPLVRQVVGPLIEKCSELAKERFDVIFHLAGAVSSACEKDLDLGLRSNVDTCRALLDALRAEGHKTRFIFASSIAVFGSDPGISLPNVVQDNTLPTPQSSYGIQKFICEQLLTDYTRKGFIDGRCGRLMTVAVRPGLPNAAASGFLSSIVREPLNNQDAVCPVPLDMSVVISSPNATVDGLLKLAEADTALLAGRTAINFPGMTVRVGMDRP